MSFDDRRETTALIVAVGLALVIYVVLTLPFRHWLIDDAGISFAYARNLASGYGLVSQPGMAPVEGFSNFLWVLLLAPLFFLNLFSPYLTAKLLSSALVGVTVYLLYRCVATVTGSRWWAPGIALLFLAGNTSYVVWTSSGLENALYGCLVAGLAWCAIKYTAPGAARFRLATVAAVLAFGTAITRPDGVLFVAAFPLVLLIAARYERTPAKLWSAQAAVYGVVWAVLFGGFLLFRWLYFHDLYPNTYYVKGGPRPADLLEAVTLQGRFQTNFYELFAGLWGDHAWLVGPIILLAGVTVLVVRCDTKATDWVLPTVLAPALFIYLLLGQDYLGEFRFATPFIVLVFPALVVLAVRIAQAVTWSQTARTVVLALFVLAMVGVAAKTHRIRLTRFHDNLPVAFGGIAERYAFRFNRIADYLELQNPSFLVPDIGATLYHSKLRIYDLAGLCDPTIAKNRRRHQQVFYDYVFDSLRPTLIHVHGYFTDVSKFDDDPRFTADYVPINAYVDAWLKNATGEERMSGDFIRRDATVGREAKLDSVRQGLAP